MTIDSNGIMKDSRTTTNSAFLNGNSNTAKANPAIELTRTPSVTVAKQTNSELNSARGNDAAKICWKFSSVSRVGRSVSRLNVPAKRKISPAGRNDDMISQ